jgi:mRNA interferase YafQ
MLARMTIDIPAEDHKRLKALAAILGKSMREKPLDPKYRNHKLKGNFVGYWECHVTPDWLLIY